MELIQEFIEMSSGALLMISRQVEHRLWYFCCGFANLKYIFLSMYCTKLIQLQSAKQHMP